MRRALLLLAVAAIALAATPRDVLFHAVDEVAVSDWSQAGLKLSLRGRDHVVAAASAPDSPARPGDVLRTVDALRVDGQSPEELEAWLAEPGGHVLQFERPALYHLDSDSWREEGLVLRQTAKGHLVVDKVTPGVTHPIVRVGDSLVGVNGEGVAGLGGDEVVALLGDGSVSVSVELVGSSEHFCASLALEGWAQAGAQLAVDGTGSLVVGTSANPSLWVGDKLMAINGQSVAGMLVDDVRALLSGEGPLQIDLLRVESVEAARPPTYTLPSAASFAELGLSLTVSEAGLLLVDSTSNVAVRVGDSLTRINGESIAGLPLSAAVALLESGPLSLAFSTHVSSGEARAEYDVSAGTWQEMGVSLTLNGALVASTTANPAVAVGDSLSRINGDSVHGKSVQQVVDLLESQAPITASFRRAGAGHRREEPFVIEAPAFDEAGLLLSVSESGSILVARSSNPSVRVGDSVYAIDGAGVAGQLVADVKARLGSDDPISILLVPAELLTSEPEQPVGVREEEKDDLAEIYLVRLPPAGWADAGIELGLRDDGRLVVYSIDAKRDVDPAVRVGDSILAVDGQSVGGMLPSEVLQQLAGAARVALVRERGEEFVGVAYEFECERWADAGVELSVRDGELVVYRVDHGSPAALALVGVGDLLVAINDRSLNNVTLGEVVTMLKETSPVRARLLHNSQPGITVDSGEATQADVLALVASLRRQERVVDAVDALWDAGMAAQDVGSVDALMSVLSDMWTSATFDGQGVIGGRLEERLNLDINNGRAHHWVGELARRMAPPDKLPHALRRLSDAMQLMDEADPLLPFVKASHLVCRGQYLVYVGEYEQADAELWPLVSGSSELGTVMAAAYPWAVSAMHAGRAEVAADFFRRNPHFEDKGWNALMALVFDAAGDYARAARHYDLGNRQAWDELQARRTEELLAELEAVPQQYSAARLREMPVSTELSRKMVFIVGLPRSGSSLLEAMLAMHSAVEARGEVQDLQEIMPADLTHPPSLERAARAGVARFAGERVTNKLLGNVALVGAISRLFPAATVIDVVRDSRDTALSIYQQQFYKIPSMAYASLPEGIQRVVAATRAVEAHWRDPEVLEALGPEFRLVQVRYEDLVAEPERIVGEVLEAMGLPWEDAVLDFHRSERNTDTASAHQVRKPLNGRAVNKWERYAPYMPWLAGLDGLQDG